MGETADAGYEVGIERTVPVGQSAWWEFLTSEVGLQLWLGDVDAFQSEPARGYETADGTTGELRSIARDERLRLTWRPAGRTSRRPSNSR